MQLAPAEFQVQFDQFFEQFAAGGLIPVFPLVFEPCQELFDFRGVATLPGLFELVKALGQLFGPVTWLSAAGGLLVHGATWVRSLAGESGCLVGSFTIYIGP